MRAAVLVESKKPLVLAELNPPGDLSYGQVLVRVHCSGICGSQIGEIDAVKGQDKYLPHLLGHEGAGVVLAVGPGVRQVREGDRVVLHWRKGTGIESQPPQYRWGGRTVNAGWVTTFNDQAVVSENRLTRIPANVDFDVASLMGCAVTTGLGVVNNNASIKIGQSVAVFGVGGVGLNVVQGSAMVSAYPIIAIDKYDAKLDLATQFGATHRINSTMLNPKEEVLKIVGSAGVDVAVDTTGLVALIEQAYDVTSAHGKTVLVGVPPAGNKVSIYTLPLHFGKILTGSHGGEADPTKDIPRYLNLVAQGKLRLREMITRTFTLDEVNEAVESMRSGEAGRFIIRMP
jgi:S-(hydroxymethyl)glutathione dehydrogenase/alcohol dehydrogenase